MVESNTQKPLKIIICNKIFLTESKNARGEVEARYDWIMNNTHAIIPNRFERETTNGMLPIDNRVVTMNNCEA